MTMHLYHLFMPDGPQPPVSKNRNIFGTRLFLLVATTNSLRVANDDPLKDATLLTSNMSLRLLMAATILVLTLVFRLDNRPIEFDICVSDSESTHSLITLFMALISAAPKSEPICSYAVTSTKDTVPSSL